MTRYQVTPNQPSTQTRFVYDGGNIASEVSSTGTLLRRYVYGAGDDRPLVWYEGSGTGNRRWLHADERGSIVAASTDGGALSFINKYDAYGIHGNSNPGGTPVDTNTGRFGFTGQAWLPELGAYNYKARIYSPTLGRFLQTDPIGYEAGMNLYNYVSGDPVNLTDPSGLEATIADIVATGERCRQNDRRGFCASLDRNIYGQPVNYDVFNYGFTWDGFERDRRIITEAMRTQTNPHLRPGTGKKVQPELKQCAIAVGKQFLEGFKDPLAIAYGYGTALNEARNRTARQDYGNPENKYTFRRSFGQAARIGLRRFIPGYLQASIISGGVQGTFELFRNAKCGLGS